MGSQKYEIGEQDKLFITIEWLYIILILKDMFIYWL